MRLRIISIGSAVPGGLGMMVSPSVLQMWMEPSICQQLKRILVENLIVFSRTKPLLSPHLKESANPRLNLPPLSRSRGGNDGHLLTVLRDSEDLLLPLAPVGSYGKTIDSDGLVNFLTNWLLNYLCHEDKKIGMVLAVK